MCVVLCYLLSLSVSVCVCVCASVCVSVRVSVRPSPAPEPDPAPDPAPAPSSCTYDICCSCFPAMLGRDRHVETETQKEAEKKADRCRHATTKPANPRRVQAKRHIPSLHNPPQHCLLHSSRVAPWGRGGRLGRGEGGRAGGERRMGRRGGGKGSLSGILTCLDWCRGGRCTVADTVSCLGKLMAVGYSATGPLIAHAIQLSLPPGRLAGRRAQKADSTLRSSQAVPHPSTDRALCCLTSEVERDPVHSTRYGRRRN